MYIYVHVCMYYTYMYMYLHPGTEFTYTIRMVGLEMLKSVFGEKATGLTYTNPSTGRERLVRVLDK